MKNEDELIPVNIFDIYPYPDAQQGLGAPQNFLVLLKGDSDERVVPITIGHFEGQALAMAIRKIAMPRPLPHDLLRHILQRMEAGISKLVIHTLEEEVFHAYLVVDAPNESFPLDCRPSDGMILAMQLGVPIFMSPQILDQVGRIIEIAESGGMTNGGESVGDVAEDINVTLPALPELSVGELDELSELDKLKVHLDWLIAQEAYEQAAQVRDQISKIENSED
ncbi:MAG: bifunctional DNase/RNase [Candidatus Latescibacterota bacterium]|jgi:bifunctional DNase/RNase